LKIQGKDFELTPIPLRTVRPFVMDQIVLTEVAEVEGFDVTDQMEVAKYLRGRVNLRWPPRQLHTNWRFANPDHGDD